MSRLLCELDKHQKELPNSKEDEYIWKDLDGFKQIYDKFLAGEAVGSICWDKIESLPESTVIDYHDLTPPEDVASLLKRLVVVKLCGGMGTSLECKGPKSKIPIRDNLTFRDMAVLHIQHLNEKYDADVPLVFMLDASEDPQSAIEKYAGLNIRMKAFNQSCYPRYIVLIVSLFFSLITSFTRTNS